MSLALPRLDDRTFGALLKDVESRIPRYAPEWTDHAESDPGIALLELFARLAQMLPHRRRRLSQPDASRVAGALAVVQHEALAFPLSDADVASVEVAVDGERWRPVASLEAAEAEEPVYASHERPDGVVVRFGDGRHGRRPPAGSSVSLTYRVGGGVASAMARWPEPATVSTKIAAGAEGAGIALRVGPGSGREGGLRRCLRRWLR